MNLPPDYHTHNLLCNHARGTPSDYVRAAARNGLAEIACTDHCPTDDRFAKESRMVLERFPDYAAQVAEAQALDPNVNVLFGIEADFYRGCEKFLTQLYADYDFDLVLGSVHFLDYWKQPKYGDALTSLENPVQLWRDYFQLVGEMADTRLFDIAAHLDLPKRFGNEINRETFREIALPALDKLAAAGMSMEINTSGLTYRCKEFFPAHDILRWAAERGIGLTLGSDAHDPERVGDGFPEAVRLARAAGFTHYQRFAKRKATAVPL